MLKVSDIFPYIIFNDNAKCGAEMMYGTVKLTVILKSHL